jgi:hypothetical protein
MNPRATISRRKSDFKDVLNPMSLSLQACREGRVM